MVYQVGGQSQAGVQLFFGAQMVWSAPGREDTLQGNDKGYNDIGRQVVVRLTPASATKGRAVHGLVIGLVGGVGHDGGLSFVGHGKVGPVWINGVASQRVA